MIKGSSGISYQSFIDVIGNYAIVEVVNWTLKTPVDQSTDQSIAIHVNPEVVCRIQPMC